MRDEAFFPLTVILQPVPVVLSASIRLHHVLAHSSGHSPAYMAVRGLRRSHESGTARVDTEESERYYLRPRTNPITGAPRLAPRRNHNRAITGCQWYEHQCISIVLDQPLRLSDFTQRWIVDDNWTYTANLTPLTGSLGGRARSASEDKTLLVFYGLDTIANIVSFRLAMPDVLVNCPSDRRRASCCLGQ